MLAKHLHVDHSPIDVTRFDLTQDALNTVDNLEAGPITKSEDQGQSGIRRSPLNRLMQLSLTTPRQIGQPSNSLKPNIFFQQLWRFFFQESLEQTHKRKDFSLRSLPVLRRKSVEGQIINLQFATRLDTSAHGIRTLFMTLDPRESAVPRPPTIAIHDDRDVARNHFSSRRHTELKNDRIVTRRPNTDNSQGCPG